MRALGNPLGLSFSGSGFLTAYQLGVATSFREHAPELLEKVTCYLGASGGSVVATLLAAAPHQLNPFVNEFCLRGRNLSGLKELLPHDAHQLVNHRLCISVTEAHTGENRVLSKFQSRDELVRSVEASCHIPPDFHPLDLLRLHRRSKQILNSARHEGAGIEIGGIRYTDGGFSNSMPLASSLDGIHQTITVSPFNGYCSHNDTRDSECKHHHICPNEKPSWASRMMALETQGVCIYMTVANIRRANVALLGGHPEVLRMFYTDGQRDGQRFLSSIEPQAQESTR